MKVFQLCMAPSEPGDCKSYDLAEGMLDPNPLALTAEALMDSIREELLDRHLDEVHDCLDDLPDFPLGEEPEYPDVPPKVWPYNEIEKYYWLESESNMMYYRIHAVEPK